MPAKKKKSTVKEVLPDPANVKDGRHNYYIGGWSFYQSVEQINAITAALVAAHTNEDREVSPLPRTNVLVLPPTSSAQDVAASEEAQRHDVVELEVADQMQIEGVSRSAVAKSARLVKRWKRPAPAAATDATNPDGAAEAAAGEAEKLVATEYEEPHEREEEGAEEAADGEAAQQSGKEDDVDEALASAPVAFGADFTVRDARLHGEITIVGVLPQMVVKPKLPEPLEPEEEQPKGKKKAGKRKSKVKLTQEQIEEMQRKREEEEARIAKETEEAIAAAAAKEEYLMTFAHPSRWAKVSLTNITFTGPVLVQRAHVTFTNCRFLYAGGDQPQLRVSQYCSVQCVKCTFESVSSSGVYALPASSVAFKRCLFTGATHASLLPLDAEAAAAAAKVSAAANPGDEGEDDGESGGRDNGTSGGSGASGDLPLTLAVRQLSASLQAARAGSVGLYQHGSKLAVDSSRFLFLGIGVLLHGKYGQEALAVPPRGTAKTTAHGLVQNCHFHHLYNTAVVVDPTARDVLLQRNSVSDCAYYGLDCKTGCSHVYVYHNTFSIGSKVRIRDGVRVQMLHNQLQEIPIDDNNYSNPTLDPTY